MGAQRGHCRKEGFTLIELSIVLVIIGLIVGGILAGQSLINAASVRAQISQIEKFNTAVNTFRGKYGALPGDLSAQNAAQFGFVARAGTQARGDGNGLIEGLSYGSSTVFAGSQEGEPLFFWEDLSQALLIAGTYNTATDAAPSATISGTQISLYLPPGKVGTNSVSVWSAESLTGAWTNHFAISVMQQINVNGSFQTAAGLTVAQAYAIDTKVDDGFPITGRVTAYFPGASTWVAPNAPTSSSSTCYDTANGNTIGEYSITISGGANTNCGLSFQFQ